jgi:hypothetical protein
VADKVALGHVSLTDLHVSPVPMHHTNLTSAIGTVGPLEISHGLSLTSSQ